MAAISLVIRALRAGLPALKELSRKPSINEIAEYTKSILGEDRVLSRGIQIYLICKQSGRMLNEIGRCFNIEASGVSQASRRIAIKISQDNKLGKKIRKIEDKLNLSGMKSLLIKPYLSLRVLKSVWQSLFCRCFFEIASSLYSSQ